MNSNHINPWSIEVRPAVAVMNGDLRRLLGSYTPPKKVEVGLDQDGFAAGWNAAIRHMRENPTLASKALGLPASTPSAPKLPAIKQLIFNNPATIIYWDDGTKTVVKCQPGDTFNMETGMAMAMLKRFLGNDNTFNRIMTHYLGKSVPLF